ncbi:MAG: hypothetical protein ACXIT9_01460 [Nitritalea sp.]
MKNHLKILTGLLLAITVSFGFISPMTNDSQPQAGFTCCPEEESHCIKDGKYIDMDRYYLNSGPCMAL